MNKLTSLYQLLESGRYDCIFVTETWIYKAVTNGLLDKQQQYTVFRKDRCSIRGGGVCVFIANRLNCSEITLADDDNFAEEAVDMLILDLVCRPNNYRFMLVYRRPLNNIGSSIAADKLCRIMCRHLNRTGPTFMLGDLNCPGIDWSFRNTPSEAHELSIHNFCESNAFHQCVTETTRVDHILDIVCTDEPLLVSSISVQPPFANSDHDSVDFELLLRCDAGANPDMQGDGSRGTERRYLWKQGDYERMSEHLSAVNWQELFTYNLTPDTIWSAFCQRLDDAIELFVPSVELRQRKKANIRRYPRHIRRLLEHKTVLWRAYKANRSDGLAKAKYVQTTSECKEAIKKHEAYLENKVIDSGNTGAFYKHVNRKLSHRSNIGSLRTSSGGMATTDAEKAEVLNKFFSSVCTQDNGNIPHFVTKTAAGDDGMNSIKFDEAKLLASARRIKTKSAASSGPDGYSVHFLKQTICSLASPLSQMFNAFMSVGKMPSSWKTAHVTPLYKKGPSSDPGNYRPISQTSNFCKLMERVIVADVTTYMQEKRLISKQQHGFLNRRSTTTNLLESLSDWTLTVDNKQTQSIIYVDFAKAFDSVSSPKLLTKLEAYGINGDLLHLIGDFMTNRVQQTRVGQSLSSRCSLNSGVVQGSCLGPLLFLLFINDLPEIFDSQVTPKLYADDLKLYASIQSDCDNKRLQENIDRLAEWARTWQLTISIKKCQTLHISRKRPDNDLTSSFHIDSAKLPNVDNVLDLGVTIDRDLKFSIHVNNIAHKATVKCRLISKSFVSRHMPTLVKAYKVYVRPILEYCSPVWSPHLAKDIERIESVQRHFTKWLPGLRGMSYSERLAATELERLDVRRLRTDLIMTYKIIFGLTCIDSALFFTFSPLLGKTRGHDYKLITTCCHSDTRRYFFCNRVLNVWNELPSNTINFSSLASFKKCIAAVDLSMYCITL